MAYLKKGQKLSKIWGSYYPFGLKQKGYNGVVSSNGNSLAQQYKFNGVQFNEDLDLNLYEMDLRQYDPSIGRWMSTDPLTHFDYSPYNAFDNNPVFWTDPSGANSEEEECPTCDVHGRQTIKNGRYISVSERQKKAKEKQDNFIDNVAIKALKEVARRKFYVDGRDFTELSESDKEKVFETDELGTIGILLWEFATGTGKDSRKFNYSKHPFAKNYLSGRILNELSENISKQLNAAHYKIGDDFVFKTFDLKFSPTTNPSSWLDSLVKHFDSNPSQFFVGGSSVDGSIKNGNLALIVTNKTSRHSLFIHIANNYPRDGTNSGNNKPLSTIKQEITFNSKIDFDN